MRTDASAGEIILLPPDVNELTLPYVTVAKQRRDSTSDKVTHSDAFWLHGGLFVTQEAQQRTRRMTY